MKAPYYLHHGGSERIDKLKPKRFYDKTAFKLVVGTMILPGLTHFANVDMSMKKQEPNTVNLFAALRNALPCKSPSKRS